MLRKLLTTFLKVIHFLSFQCMSTVLHSAPMFRRLTHSVTSFSYSICITVCTGECMHSGMYTKFVYGSLE